MIKELTQEYKRLMLSQQIDPKSLDYNLFRKHINRKLLHTTPWKTTNAC